MLNNLIIDRNCSKRQPHPLKKGSDFRFHQLKGVRLYRCKFQDPKVRFCIVVFLSSSKQLLIIYKAGLWDPMICTSSVESASRIHQHIAPKRGILYGKFLWIVSTVHKVLYSPRSIAIMCKSHVSHSKLIKHSQNSKI